MQARESLIQELEASIARGSSRQHADTLRRVTDLFVEGAAGLGEEHVRLFDDVIRRFAAEIETKARAELARRLAPIDNAPPDTMRDLAHDEAIEVAAPVLVRSKQLSDADLVNIAHSRGQAHLLAISSRPRLGEVVTDVLVSRGDKDVLLNVASNLGADFSDRGYATLVDRADSDESLALRVGERPDLPPHLVRKLVAKASEMVQRRLLASSSPGMRAEIQRVLADVSHEIDPGAPVRRSFTAAERLMRMLHQAGALGESELHDLARSRRYEETVAALSLLCRVPIDHADGLMNGDRLEPLLILLKASGFEWMTVRALIVLRPSGRRISAKELEEVCDDYRSLSYATARRVILHWQQGEAGLKAAG